MSLAASQRRDQRRRLVLSWNRSESTPSSTSTAATGRLADYSPEALPEHQPSLATLLPTSLTRFSLAALGLLTVVFAAIGVGAWEAVAGGPVFGQNATRFAATLAAVRRCLDVHSFLSLGGWLAQVCLVVATATALIVRLMRRHRRDDYRGRYRAWGWLAGLFTLTACAGQVPLGSLIASLASDSTGITLGPSGMGWWLLTAGIAYGVVGLWAVLPLHERAATGIWLSLCLAAWAAAATCSWVALDQAVAGREWHLAIGNVCWIAGAAFAAIAMLAAARSVLREVRGLPTRVVSRKASHATASPQATAKPVAATAVSERDEDIEEGRSSPDDHEDNDHRSQHRGHTRFVDGEDASDFEDESRQSGRHLSKAERKRLKKLAHMSRAA